MSTASHASWKRRITAASVRASAGAWMRATVPSARSRRAAQERLLQRVVGVMQRGEQAIAVRVGRWADAWP
jgi:hypothetical protein